MSRKSWIFAFSFFAVFVFAQKAHALETNPGVNASASPNPADTSVTISVTGGDGTNDQSCPAGSPIPRYVFNLRSFSKAQISGGPFDGQLLNLQSDTGGSVGNCSTGDIGDSRIYVASATFNVSGLANGTYSMTVNVTNNMGFPGLGTVSFTVVHPNQQVYVVSNLATSWMLNGPNGTNQGSMAAPGTYTYPSMPTGSYSISPFAIQCYNVSVNQNPQTLNSGGSITFYLTYSSDNTCGVPPPPPPPPGPSPNPPPPPPTPSQVICAPSNSSVNPGQSVTFSAVNGSGSGYSWSAPGANPSTGSGSVFTASFPSVNNYTITVTNGTSAQCQVSVVQTGPPVVPPPPPAPSISFAITYQTTPGTINVNSNVPTHWIVSNGTNSYEGVYPSTAGIYTAAPGDYTITADTLPGFTGPQLVPSSGTLSANGTLNFNIYYLAIPANLSANPSGCNQVTLSWTGAGPSVSYFQVFRSTSSDPATMQLLSGNLPGNTTTSYTDNTVSANTTYYYMVKSFLTSPSMSASSSVVSAFAQACTPNLANSAKNIYQVQYDGKTWTAYDATRIIPDGVGIRFVVFISNSGDVAARIDGIQDTVTSNVKSLSNPRIDYGSGCMDVDPNSCAKLNITGSAPAVMAIGQDIQPNSNWRVSFEGVVSLPSGTNGLLKNIATIKCTYSGGSCDVTRSVSYVYSSAPAKSPEFKEVAP